MNPRHAVPNGRGIRHTELPLARFCRAILPSARLHGLGRGPRDVETDPVEGIGCHSKGIDTTGIRKDAILGEGELQAAVLSLKVGLIVAATVGAAVVQYRANLSGVG